MLEYHCFFKKQLCLHGMAVFSIAHNMVNSEGTILHKTGHDHGRIHDYEIFKNKYPTPPQVKSVLDQGYLGVQNDFSTVKSVLSIRKNRKKKRSNRRNDYSFFIDYNNLFTVIVLVFAAMTTCFYGVNYNRSWSKFGNTKGGTKMHHMDKGKESAIVSLH